jgi:membrane protease YdiL (CAAX protease family)
VSQEAPSPRTTPDLPPRTTQRRSQLRELLYLGLIVVAYLLGLQLIEGLPGPLATWARLTLPNLWLIGASAAVIRGRDQRIALTRGGRRAWILAAIAAVVAALVILAAVGWTPAGGTRSPQHTAASLLVVLLVPAAEELYFRALLLDHLAQGVGRPLAALLVSALFGLLHHLQGLALPMAALSLALCGATLAAGSALWAVGLHVGWNALARLRWAPLAGAGRWTVAGLAVAAMAALVARGLTTRDDEKHQ